ncbi:MAG: site-specific integrase [Polyangiaceae bacterium]|nr:site-specific integrase [Polyangiaceae bacterium]
MNTRRAYAREWERWEAYAFEHGASALPASPLVVAAYMAHLDAEGLAPSSLDVAMAAIVDRHRDARVALPSNDPVVRDVLRGFEHDAVRNRPAGCSACCARSRGSYASSACVRVRT